jgi:membrane fusion protein (multidrug efflux system)
MSRRWSWILASLTATFLIAGCGGAKRGGFQMPPVPVEVAEASRGTVRDQFRALGSVEASEIVKVTNEVNAVVRQMPFDEGQSVAKGQLLAQLDDAEIGAEAKRAEALRDQARVNHARIKQLADQNAAAPQELDDASAALKVAEANFSVANARFEKTRIRSPLRGVVGRRLVSPGAFLRVGDPITEVAAVDEMKLTFSAPERYVAHLKRGARVDITTTAYPGRVFRGRVTVVDPILDPASRTVQLVALVANPGRLLRSGMSADVSATLSERTDALTVPDEAVFGEGDQSFVYVVKPDSTVARSAILIGTRDSARVEVTQGLQPGDLVVRAGYQKLYDGARVMPMSAAALQGAANQGGPAGGPAASGSGETPAKKAASGGSTAAAGGKPAKGKR